MDDLIAEIKFRQDVRRAHLQRFISENERPKWWPYYPARAAVEASKAQLAAMDEMNNMGAA